MRLDVYLVENGIFHSRELAKLNILRGNILVNGKPNFKPSTDITSGVTVSLAQQNILPYVSRGGLKLERAIREFNIDCQGAAALDVGASTGGFTDCLLKHGAKSVCAIDVGTNQLAAVLREDSRVASIENINIKDLTPEMLEPKKFDIIVADLSFISLTKVIGYFRAFLADKGVIIVLIKPQFEVGSVHISKGGIVKNPKAHQIAIENVCLAARENEFYLNMLTYAPITDGSKNIEYLALFERNQNELPNFEGIISQAFATKKGLKNTL